MSVKRVILFIVICEQGNYDWKNCKNLRAHVQISLQMRVSTLSLKETKTGNYKPTSWV